MQISPKAQPFAEIINRSTWWSLDSRNFFEIYLISSCLVIVDLGKYISPSRRNFTLQGSWPSLQGNVNTITCNTGNAIPGNFSEILGSGGAGIPETHLHTIHCQVIVHLMGSGEPPLPLPPTCAPLVSGTMSQNTFLKLHISLFSTFQLHRSILAFWWQAFSEESSVFY